MTAEQPSPEEHSAHIGRLISDAELVEDGAKPTFDKSGKLVDLDITPTQYEGARDEMDEEIDPDTLEKEQAYADKIERAIYAEMNNMTNPDNPIKVTEEEEAALSRYLKHKGIARPTSYMAWNDLRDVVTAESGSNRTNEQGGRMPLDQPEKE